MKNKILVIEDDTAISELLCMNLSAAGYRTAVACDGDEAVRLITEHPDADLALVDIMLPGRDGLKRFLSVQVRRKNCWNSLALR